MVVLVLLGGSLWWVSTGHGGGRHQHPLGTPPQPMPVPPNRISLQGWKLTIPEKDKSGHAAVIEPAAVEPPWLTESPDGSLSFWAPVRGATTPHSQHARTELDSLSNFSAATSGPHTLKAASAVRQVPTDTQDIILGQIHGAGAISSVPYVMLHYRAGTIEVVARQQQSGSQTLSFPLLNGVPLNQRFSFTISDIGNGTMVFSATYGTQTKQAIAQVPQNFHDATVRFQVGDYQQAHDSPDTEDGGRVTFYQIDELTTTP
ncbi:polysaccharide lyase family 7 protein [Nocardia vinacea]|uniref:polysaccharide lyase family 7 protein n=1 Tax=Nocardia vinacea TaxID=96468 RepID=UPI000593B001|nr:polysaccharide lyase family 7 protein [Nocardia vinacea]